MREKRKYQRLDDAVVLDILLRYHRDGEGQRAIAARYGVAPSYVSRLCHGETRRSVYERAREMLERVE